MKISQNTLISIGIIILIFFVGFFLRMESVHLNGIPVDEKTFYQDQNDLPYMYELDSYYNYRLTQNYLDHEYMGDKIINGTEWDVHSYYPGVPMDYPPLIIYITTFIYKFVNLFSQIPLLTVCFWLPAFIGPLSGIPAYLFVRRITNDFGGFVAGILAVISPFYFLRSVPGWFDTDMFIILFSILVVWFFTESLLSKNKRNQLIFVFLSAFSMFLFSMAWNGWQYLFLLLFSFCVIYIIYGKLKGKNIDDIFHIFTIFFLGSVFLILCFTGFLNILKLFCSLSEFIKITGSQNIWAPFPNLYLSISELRIPSIIEIIIKIDPILFGFGIFGLVFMPIILIKKEINSQFNNVDWFLCSFLILWTLIGFISIFKGVRFIMLLLPPLIISVGIMVGILVEYLKILNIKKSIFYFSYIFIIILVAVIPVFSTFDTCKALTPGINDDSWSSAKWIQNNTPNNTVIISDWSYGHFYSAIADRSVALDGRSAYIETLPLRQFYNTSEFNPKSPSTSRDYWINRAFSTSDENLSLGIFRMLSTSGDAAYLKLDEYTGNTSESINVLNSILGVDKKTAQMILINNYHLTQEQSINILNYTHPDNSTPFVIVTSNGMINKGYWTFNFGNWNFNEVKGENYTYSLGDISITKSFLNTNNDIIMDLTTNNIKWQGKLPYNSIIIKEGKVKKSYYDQKSNFCIILCMDTKKAIVIDKRFENSVFTKLVIEKSNSTFLKPVFKNKSVIVWKINENKK